MHWKNEKQWSQSCKNTPDGTKIRSVTSCPMSKDSLENKWSQKLLKQGRPPRCGQVQTGQICNNSSIILALNFYKSTNRLYHISENKSLLSFYDIQSMAFRGEKTNRNRSFSFWFSFLFSWSIQNQRERGRRRELHLLVHKKYTNKAFKKDSHLTSLTSLLIY